MNNRTEGKRMSWSVACGASGLLGAAFAALAPLPAYADTIVIGPQAMEGNLQVHPGDIVQAGISFTMPGSHPASTVQFVDSRVTFANVECSSGSGGGSFSVELGSAGTVGPVSIPQNNSNWFPTGDQSSPLSYQGSTAVPDLCAGGTMSLRNGGTFSAGAQSSDLSDALNVRFHYSANGTSGSWSATRSVVPSALSVTSVPVGAIGAIGLSLVLGSVLLGGRAWRARRRSSSGRLAPASR